MFTLVNKVASVVYHPQSQSQSQSQYQSPFAKSDNNILDEIYHTHVHADASFDDDSLFFVVESILKRATQSVDQIVQGTQLHVEDIEEQTPKANFNVPLCTLKGITCEMQCKPPGEEITHETTLALLHKLSNYSWEAKASLTLAAFAMEFGEFWLLAELCESNPLAKSIALLKRLPVLLEPSQLQKRRQAILELNMLIKATLEVIRCIDQSDKLSTSYDLKDVPELSETLNHIPVDVYWAIMTVVACATKLTILTSDEDREFDMSLYSQKIRSVLNNFKTQLSICQIRIDFIENYKKLKKLLRTPTEVMEIFKGLVSTKDNVQPLIDCSTEKTVSIEILRRNNILFFISTLDITDNDISILKPVHEFIKRENQYKIVWIPIVETWTEELKRKFETLKAKMPWLTVQDSSQIAGIKFIQEEWNFKGKPILVVMNPQGKVEHADALNMIRVWGVKAFPFTKDIQRKLTSDPQGGIHSIVVDGIHPSLPSWIGENKYIFFYGGKDKEWITQFTKKATALASNPFLKEENIHIELVCVGKGSKGEDDLGVLGKFWTGIESLFLTKVHKPVDTTGQEIQKLVSYKNESGWVLLTKGSTLLATGHGSSVLKVVEDFEKWRELVKEKGFESSFKAHYGKVIETGRPRCHLDIPRSTGKVPEVLECPDCHRSMEIFVSYKCCHIDGLTAHH